MKNLAGKEVLITGAASGIGRETALVFATAGARLWLADISQSGLKETAKRVESAGGVARTLVCNVADYAAVEAMAATVHADIDALDVLINNAGIASAGRFLDASLETWQKVMDINVMGVVHGCRAFLPRMIEHQKQGQVVNMSSAAAFVAAPDMPVYASSKFAVFGLSEALRADMSQHGIGVTTICPGVINTPIVSSSIMEGGMGQTGTQDKIEAFYQKRNYTPERVAQNILKAVRHNTAVQPVSPEAWGMYLAKRFAPGLVGRISRFQLPFHK